MDNNFNYAPGWPGSEPRWTSSAKSGIGTALNRVSEFGFLLVMEFLMKFITHE